MEPATPWKNKAGQLQQKNKHNVPAAQIKIKLDTFEKIDSMDTFLKAYQLTDLKRTPAMRHFPVEEEFIPVRSDPKPDPPNRAPFWDEGSWIQIEKKNERTFTNHLEPKPARNPEKNISDFTAWTIDDKKTDQNETANFQNEPIFNGIWQDPPVEDKSNNKKFRKTPTDSPQPQRNQNSNKKKNGSKFSPHYRGCPNESQVFAHIAEIYPQIGDEHLWDLFVKTNGDAEWTVDLLLSDENIDQMKSGNTLKCNCLKSNSTGTPGPAKVIFPEPKLVQQETPKKKDVKRTINLEEKQNLIKSLTEKVQMNENAYPDHVSCLLAYFQFF
jgi:hypothetical protein